MLGVLSCSREQPPGPARAGEQPLQILHDFTMTESDSGVMRYVVKARIARVYSGDVTRAEDVQVDFYDDGQKASVLRAKQGFLDGEGRLRAEGNVVVTSLEGGVLETETLVWDRQAKKIRADGEFKITNRGEPITGIGLTTDPHLSLVEVDRDLDATFKTRPEAGAR
jgi:LPS export ABC transporter protein LptC